MIYVCFLQVNADSEIQSKLGNFSQVGHYIVKAELNKNLIGIESVPSSPAPNTGHSRSSSSSSYSSRGYGGNPGTNGSQEFKKPGGPRQSSSSTSSSSQRSSSHFAKPADTKLPYSGRSGYPSQPVKHGTGEHRSSSSSNHGSSSMIMPNKSSNSSSNSSHGSSGARSFNSSSAAPVMMSQNLGTASMTSAAPSGGSCSVPVDSRLHSASVRLSKLPMGIGFEVCIFFDVKNHF